MNAVSWVKNFALRSLLATSLLVTLTLWASQASARDIVIPLQGLLTDAKGAPVQGAVEVTFSLYPDASSPTSVWTETRMIEVDSGLFTTYLGQVNPLGSELTLQHPGLHFAMSVASDAETERVPLGHALMAARAEHAVEAQTLQGKSLAEIEQRAVTAQGTSYERAQSELTGANVQAALDEVVVRLKALEADNTALRARVQALEGLNLSQRVGSLESAQQGLTTRQNSAEQTLMNLQSQVNTTSQTVSGFNSRINAAEMSLTTQGGRIASLEMSVTGLTSRLNTAETTLSGLTTSVNAADSKATAAQTQATSNRNRLDTLEPTVNGQATSLTNLTTRVQAVEAKTSSITTSGDGRQVYFTGVNLHVRSGSNSTTGTVNGLGNLIIGYDEARFSGSLKTGSHNLVMGRNNNYTSYGSFVGGSENSVTGPYSAVLSGDLNVASSSYSVIVTGYQGVSSAFYSSILTGWINQATGSRSAVVGGEFNKAQSMESAILGGSRNETSSLALQSTIAGGDTQMISTSKRFRAQGTIAP